LASIVIIGVLAYLIGSIPFGVVLAKIFRLPDPRTIGSGNIGATNMLRTGNKKVALLTLVLDAGKGAAAVMLAAQLHDTPSTLALAALSAMLGHMYSPWLKFNGGKGVATMLGGALAISFYVGLVFCAAWLAIFLITFYVSLASIAALIAIPVAALFLLNPAAAILLAIASAIAIYKHRANIARLRAGTEPKMGKGVKK
jgi:glycerol-3-phosphate acyltransferase PlsY